MGICGINNNYSNYIRIKKRFVFKDFLIWIDPNVDNKENSEYKDELEYLCFHKIKLFKNIEKALNTIKSIKFEETIIIVSGSFYLKFIDDFKKNLKDIYIITRIVIFTNNKNNKLLYEKNYELINHPFYDYGGIKTLFEQIIDFITEEKNKKIKSFMIYESYNENKDEYEKNVILKKISSIEEDNNYQFKYIASKEKLALPSLYQMLIESHLSNKEIKSFFHFLYNKYKDNSSINNLLNSINISSIPYELLSKYYIRIYTDEDSQFYKNINKDLRENNKKRYLAYISVLNEGVKLEALPLASDKILYRGVTVK